MKKLIIAALLLLVSCSSLLAQDDDSKKYEKIRAIKVGFITDRMHMSGDQATRFWPVYDAYQNERRAVRREYIEKYLSTHSGATRDQARATLEGNIEYQGRELDLKKKYKDRLLQVISSQQLDELYQAERDFRRSLVDQLKD